MGLLRWKSAVTVKGLAVASNLEENSLVVADKNLAITKNTPYEELVKKIKSEPAVCRRDIFRQIMSAYFFFRVVLCIVHRKMTIEESYILDPSAIYPQTKGHLLRSKIAVYENNQILQGVLHSPYPGSACRASGIV